MITLEEARDRVGAGVVFRSAAMREGRDGRPPAPGRIVRVGVWSVLVDYDGVVMSTYPADLEFSKSPVDTDH